jgi:tetratricopeptide (TPR) repeat protein
LYTPQRLFGESGSSSDILSHEPFLERARLQRELESEASARLALGAYVVARLVDKMLVLENDPEAFEGFRWQLEAVSRHVADLPGDAPETAHLSGIVTAVSSTGRPTKSLWMNLTAYAYFLEHEARLEESLEMLNLAVRSQGTETPAADFAAYALFAGRLNRLLARWELASACYGAAEEAASQIGDRLLVLRGRLGRGAVLRGQGNYPAARAAAESVVREANEFNLPDAQALAYADLGVIYSLQGLQLDALEAHYQAFQLNTDGPQRMRALGDLALGLAEIGAHSAARIAFQIVVESNASVLVRANALLELMDLESSAGNRVAFERFRTAAEETSSRMSPSMTVDYQYKIGIGLARFGQHARAKAALTAGLQLAERHKLNGWYFKLEQAVGELAAAPDKQPVSRQVSELCQAPSVKEMEVGLREYASAPAD